MKPLRAFGVTRMHDNDQGILVSFDRKPTDDELRDLHDTLAGRRVASSAGERTFTPPATVSASVTCQNRIGGNFPCACGARTSEGCTSPSATERRDAERMEYLFDLCFEDEANTPDKLDRIRRTVDKAIAIKNTADSVATSRSVKGKP